jgi:hypothetical protein
MYLVKVYVNFRLQLYIIQESMSIYDELKSPIMDVANIDFPFKPCLYLVITCFVFPDLVHILIVPTFHEVTHDVEMCLLTTVVPVKRKRR